MLPDGAIIPIKEPFVTDYLTIAEITPALKKFATLKSVTKNNLFFLCEVN